MVEQQTVRFSSLFSLFSALVVLFTISISTSGCERRPKTYGGVEETKPLPETSEAVNPHRK